jgi:hypothetical protein
LQVKVTLETPTRLVALDAGRCVGTLTFFRNRVHFHLRIYSVIFADFAPDTDVGSVARHLYGALARELRPANPLLLRTAVDEGDDLYAVLRALGFRDYRRVYSPVLDVSAFDLGSLQAAERKFAVLGYEIVRLADLTPTAEVEAQLYDLHTEVYTDTSTAVQATPEQFPRAEWLGTFVYSDSMIAEAFFIAVKGDAFVGFGNLFRGEAAGELETGTFGTKRSHRHHHR